MCPQRLQRVSTSVHMSVAKRWWVVACSVELAAYLFACRGGAKEKEEGVGKLSAFFLGIRGKEG